MKKNILLFIILLLTLGLFAQKVEQQTRELTKPVKKDKVKFEARYYELMKENDDLKLQNGRKDTKIYKYNDQLKTKNNEIKRLQMGNAKVNEEKSVLFKENKNLKLEIRKLKAANKSEQYKAEIEYLKKEIAKLELELEAAKQPKKKAKLIKVEQQ